MLVAVINDESKIDGILIALSNLGIKGATVLDSIGMGGILGISLPFFKKAESFVRVKKPENKTLFTVIDDDKKLNKAIEIMKELLEFPSEGKGVIFVLPVLEIHGTVGTVNEDDISEIDEFDDDDDDEFQEDDMYQELD